MVKNVIIFKDSIKDSIPTKIYFGEIKISVLLNNIQLMLIKKMNRIFYRILK